MGQEFIRILQGSETFGALQEIQSRGTPAEIAQRYDALVRDIYWKARDIGALIAIASGGIHYCLTKMDESSEAEVRDLLGGFAKKLAFNLASFLWPGWDESGVSLTQRDVAVGLNAARLNLRLAKELNKPPDRVEDAHWLLGAHLLAADDAAAAVEEFEQCSPDTRPLFRGYLLMAQALLGTSGAQQQFNELLEAMSHGRDEDDQPNANQLATAFRVFTS